MKKIILSIIFMITTLLTSTQIVYAADAGSLTDSGWVDDALSATKNFLNEDLASTDTLNGGNGLVRPVLSVFDTIIKSINTILLVVLAWLSAISITITGARYLASGASPNQRKVASQNLKTVIKGMAFGFGAYIIWRVAMGLLIMVLNS